jgi:hypothetical protein
MLALLETASVHVTGARRIFVLTSDTCVHKVLNDLLGLLEVEIAANKIGLLNSVVHGCKDGLQR